MKVVTYILSILILFVSFTPCSDEKYEEPLGLEEIDITHDHQEDSEDSCPVTCICDCCGMSITYEPIVAFTLKMHTEISTLLFSTYNAHYRFDFFSIIWQPPQLIG